MTRPPATPPGTPSAHTRPATATFAAIDPARCTGCGWCLATCPDQLLAFASNGWRKQTVLLDRARCDGCGHCAAKCPVGAIAMRRHSLAAAALAPGDAPASAGQPD